MRITLDTNVLVSAFIEKLGHPANLLELCLTIEDMELVLSQPILKEFEEVLKRDEVRERFSYTDRDIREIVNRIRTSSRIVFPRLQLRMIRSDPKDDVILWTACDGKADYIVSGDRHLLNLKRFRGIKIVSPTEMMEIISKKFPEFVFRF